MINSLNIIYSNLNEVFLDDVNEENNISVVVLLKNL